MSYTSPWKSDFPIFAAHAQPHLCYLDNASTTFMPKTVVDAIYHYQCFQHANSHRGLYQLSNNATQTVEAARIFIANFLNAKSSQEVIFTSGTTEAINLVAHTYLKPRLHQAANIIVSQVEHHANFLCWQLLCQQFGAELPEELPGEEEGVVFSMPKELRLKEV